MKLFHVIVIYKGVKYYMTKYPMTHDKCCAMLSKITKYPNRIETLKEA